MTPAEKRAVQRAIRVAALHCGDCPAVATMNERRASAHAAGIEVDRSTATWNRWTRRFNPDPQTLEVGSERLATRYWMAKGLFDQRAEAIELLTGPAKGSA